ncbi:MAG: type I-E CRISPR-associated protein Cas5/CasD [Cellulomonadaceae bacterium]|nr:type I-E CRISPR-associated protein Cas5/CasD [Cellulomonadaceae bacterium]
MSTLLLRLAGPAQSWSGVQLYPSTVQTERVPTRSGVLGLLACCLGARQGHWPAWIEDITAWVRVDRPGDVRTDFQTVNGVPDHMESHFARSAVAENPRAPKPKIQLAGEAYNLRQRRFLAGAEFILAIEHDRNLSDLTAAVASPAFMPYLGRKAFAPTFPFVLGVSDLTATQATEQIPTVPAPPGTAGTAGASTLEVYPLVSDRNVTHHAVVVPNASRKEQLAWASTHLTR